MYARNLRRANPDANAEKPLGHRRLGFGVEVEEFFAEGEQAETPDGSNARVGETHSKILPFVNLVFRAALYSASVPGRNSVSQAVVIAITTPPRKQQY
jgi:hypothetical protein